LHGVYFILSGEKRNRNSLRETAGVKTVSPQVTVENQEDMMAGVLVEFRKSILQNMS